jgi:hypothetical protein
MRKQQTELQGRIFNRDFIYRKRKSLNRWEFAKKLNKFRSYQFGKFSLYVSVKPTVFWNMAGIVSTTARDYTVQPK